jgi:hypothetical protein
MVIEPKSSTQIILNTVMGHNSKVVGVSTTCSLDIRLHIISTGCFPEDSPTHSPIFSRSCVGVIYFDYTFLSDIFNNRSHEFTSRPTEH